MLDVKNAHIDFGRQLQPPPGYEIDYAVATTYTLDLYALLTIPLAMYYRQTLDSEISEDNLLIEIMDGNPLVRKTVLAKVKNNQLTQKTVFEGPSQDQIIFKTASNIYLEQKNEMYKYDSLSDFNNPVL